jgi:hypothetical protein
LPPCHGDGETRGTRIMSAREQYTDRNAAKRVRSDARRSARRGKATQRELGEAAYTRLILAADLGFHW